MTRIEERRKGNEITSAELEAEFGIGGAKVREIVEALRDSGRPIGSNGNGYYRYTTPKPKCSKPPATSKTAQRKCSAAPVA